MTAFHGQMGMFVRALSYMLSHGADGLKQATEDAVLNANYVQASLSSGDMSPAFGGICMHEALFNDDFLKGHRRRNSRLCQSYDRRRLSPHDHVFPIGRPRCHAHRANRE